MLAVIQRVREAAVHVDGREVSRIGPGILTLIGVEKGDTEEQARKLVEKIIHLRIFEDAEGKMNLSLLDSQGSHMVVSQFTLAGNCDKGRRPSFDTAAPPDQAKPIYEATISASRQHVKTEGGTFQADMKVSLINDGPVTFVLRA
jgi:D-tyrosyl-tRNA(Tyr) deacylase